MTTTSTAAAEGRIGLAVEDRPEGRIATLAFDNPSRLNAIGSQMMRDFRDAAAELAADTDLRAVIVTGAGERAFAGGVDIREMAAIEGPDAARAFILQVHGICAAVRAIPVPVIARVQGYCFGGALELACACDLRIAAETARFGMPEVRLGIPSVVEAALLPLLIGWGRTRRLLMTGETIDAATALAWGLVEQVAPADGLDVAVEACLADILACGPTAIRQQKALMQAWERLPLAEAVQAGVETFADAYRGDEPARMMADFLAAQAARKGR
ncbi:MAG TPA: enoyl-CoA hydratase [Caulobacteraceae bacterium]|jgi:enoyl-CoA hydratase/carnithine racemase